MASRSVRVCFSHYNILINEVGDSLYSDYNERNCAAFQLYVINLFHVTLLKVTLVAVIQNLSIQNNKEMELYQIVY